VNDGFHALLSLAANAVKTVNQFSEEQVNPSLIAPQGY
jgi:hypothetical protein